MLCGRTRVRYLDRVRPVDRPVQRRKSALLNFAAFRSHRIQVVTMSQLPGAQILRDGPDAVANVIAGQFQSGFVVPDAAQGNMYMRMLSIEMRDGHPLQLRSEVFLHPRHEIAGQPVKVEPLAELR